MANKWQIDNETKYPRKGETDKQRFERLKKRVVWKLALSEDDEKFYDLERYPNKKLLLESNKNANPNETLEEKKARLKELAKQKVKDLKSQPNEPVDRSYGSSGGGVAGEGIGKRGGKYNVRISKNGTSYRQYF
tara:strand:- start:68 stop:469 length:402 start_codon:yes stop_codon:yes gene_type:complete